ncbi:MAG: hypothetical protein ACE5FD_14100, partial [Anaerolineae bacterium]
MTRLLSAFSLQPSALVLRWGVTAVLWFTLLLLGTNWLGGRWALIAGLVMAYGLWALWRGLPENHRAGET